MCQHKHGQQQPYAVRPTSMIQPAIQPVKAIKPSIQSIQSQRILT
jgi:hypothetical protein